MTAGIIYKLGKLRAVNLLIRLSVFKITNHCTPKPAFSVLHEEFVLIPVKRLVDSGCSINVNPSARRVHVDISSLVLGCNKRAAQMSGLLFALAEGKPNYIVQR